MDKNELLKYLICEIDLVMHDKDYRFENEDGTWYSRESCKNLTNEEVFEELKGELRQLAKIEDDFADLEAKLADFNSKIVEEMELNAITVKKYTKPFKEKFAEWMTMKENFIGLLLDTTTGETIVLIVLNIMISVVISVYTVSLKCIF